MNNYRIIKNTEWKEVEVNGEIKEIPVGWSLNSFEKEFSRWIDHRGISPEKTKNKLSIPLLTTKIVRDGFIMKPTEFITRENFLERNKRGQVQRGDLIFTTEAPVGNVVLFDNPVEMALGQRMIAISSKENLNLYFKFCFKEFSFKELLKKYSGGSTAEGIKSQTLKKLEIKVPPISQQTSIATILSAQESIINDMETLVEKYEARLTYLSEELLSGRLRIKEVDGKTIFYKNTEWKEVEVNGEMKEIPVDWEVNKVSDVFEIQRGSVLSKDYIKNNSGIYPVYSSATENNGSIGNIKTYMFDGEFLTWTTDGVYAGTVFYRNGKFNCTNICGLLKIKDNQKSINGISYFVRQELKKHVNHIGNSKLMSNTVSNVELVYASQRELFLISSFMLKKELLIFSQKELLEKEKKKFTFLLNNLLSGKYLVEENMESDQ